MDLRVSTDRDLPIVSLGEWDGDQAKEALFKYAGFDSDEPDPQTAAEFFLYYDADKPELKGSYYFPIATISNGAPVVPVEALAAAAGYLPKASAPKKIRNQARNVLDHYYKRRDDEQQAEKSLASRLKYPWTTT